MSDVQYVLELSDRHELVGPFPTRQAAFAWADAHPPRSEYEVRESTALPLRAPEASHG